MIGRSTSSTLFLLCSCTLAPRSARPRILVPAVVLVSFAPDLLVLTVGATALNIVGLMAMHVVAAAITVPQPHSPCRSVAVPGGLVTVVLGCGR